MKELGNDTADYYAQLMNFYNETVEFERKIGIIIPSIFAAIVVVGTIGLAVSDLMFLFLCVPFTAIDYAVPVWLFPAWMCSMINFFQHTSAYCSVWTLTLMAVDRYLAVVYPVSSMTLRTPKNTLFALIVIYFVIVASQIPIGLMHGIYVYDFIVEERSTCAIVSIATNTASETEAQTYFITFNVFGYILPLGISVFLYWRMLRRLWYTPQSGHSLVRRSMRARPEARRAKKKVTRLVLSVLVIWAVCWLPLNVCFFMSGISYPDTLVMKYGVKMVVIQITSQFQVLAYTNSCLNPILYALMSENFRKGFINIIKRIINLTTLGAFFESEDKNFLRIELTNMNNTSQNSIRHNASLSLKHTHEGSFLLRKFPCSDNMREAEVLRTRSSTSFHL